MKRWWVVAVALLSIGGAAEAQYRWRDAGGQVNYGDFPPGDARDLKAVDARAPVETADANLALPFELRRAKALYPVVLYSSDACPPCENARVYLRQRGVPFSRERPRNPGRWRAAQAPHRVRAVPVMTIGRDVLGGFRSNDWSRALDAAGYPAESMLPAGYRANRRGPWSRA